MPHSLLRFDGAVPAPSPAVDAWFRDRPVPLGVIALRWFEVIRSCGDEVHELVHDGCPTACLGDVPFAYVNVFTAHVNVGFFQGTFLKDPAHLLQGSGKFMRHVKLRPGVTLDEPALHALIQLAWDDIKARVELS